MNDERLADLYRRARAARDRRSPGAGGVDPERIVDLVEGRLSEAERVDLMRRLLDQPNGLAELELVRSLVTARPDGQETRRRRAPVWLAVAAMAFLVVGPVLVVLSRRGPEPTRGTGAAWTVSGPERVRPGDSLGFAWRAIPGAVVYELVIADAAGVPVLTRVTSDTGLRIGPLDPGGYRWWVRVTRESAEPRRSAIGDLTVR